MEGIRLFLTNLKLKMFFTLNQQFNVVIVKHRVFSQKTLIILTAK